MDFEDITEVLLGLFTVTIFFGLFSFIYILIGVYEQELTNHVYNFCLYLLQHYWILITTFILITEICFVILIKFSPGNTFFERKLFSIFFSGLGIILCLTASIIIEGILRLIRSLFNSFLSKLLAPIINFFMTYGLYIMLGILCIVLFFLLNWLIHKKLNTGN